MLNSKGFFISLFLGFITIVFFFISVFFPDSLHPGHSYAVSSSGRTYYIDDYTIEDGSIIFSIDGVEYHFSNYSIREIEK